MTGVKDGTVFNYRGIVCVIQDKTRVCLDIVGWNPRVLKKARVFLAHFHCDNCVTKTDTDTFSQFLVLNALVLDTHKKTGGTRNLVRIFNGFLVNFRDGVSRKD